MAAVRLRRALHYPEESDGDSGREELDEQDQEQIILGLQRQNDARNAQYSLIFTIIPLASTIAFGQSLFSASTLTQRGLSFLGIVSLLGTAHLMRYSPLHQDRKGKKPISADDEYLSQIHAVLLPVNGTLCGLLVLYSFLATGGAYLYLVPGVMLVAVLLARQVMLSVDLSTLKDLQYGYKGA